LAGAKLERVARIPFVKVTTIAGLRVRIAGGTDREGSGPGPVVVLLHGFGAPGDDLVPLWRTLGAPAGTRFVFPEAPFDLGIDGGNARAWWMIDLEARMRRQAQGKPLDAREIPDGLEAARAQVDALLGELPVVLPSPPPRLVLGGFSQGAMLSLDVALHSSHALAGLLLMSGTHIAAEEWASRYERRRGLPIFMSHGRDDDLLPFFVAEGLRDELVSRGLPVEWQSFSGGHGIPWEVLERAGGFLRRVLG
jgi:phospholipase/carboxylesterase